MPVSAELLHSHVLGAHPATLQGVLEPSREPGGGTASASPFACSFKWKTKYAEWLLCSSGEPEGSPRGAGGVHWVPVAVSQLQGPWAGCNGRFGAGLWGR